MTKIITKEPAKTGLKVTTKDALLNQLKNLQSQDDLKSNKLYLPKIGYFTKDKIEKKGKDVKLIQEAGRFYIEKKSDKKDKDGKNIYEKELLGTDIDVTILYRRRQLAYYNNDTEVFVVSGIYDQKDEIVDLWSGGNNIKSGRANELQKLKEYTKRNEKGKEVTTLKETIILYVKMGEEFYQMNVKGSSFWVYKNYINSIEHPAYVKTNITSQEKTAGTNTWNELMFSSTEISDAEIKQNIEDVQYVIKGLEFFKEDAKEVSKEVIEVDPAGLDVKDF